MWKRMKRAFRSMFGWMISAAEDPELILEQNIRDLNDQVPKMNESIAMVKANVTLLEKENQKYKNDVVELTSKVKAAIQATRDDIATTYATQLQTVKGALARNEQQLLGARQAFDKAMQVKQAFMRREGPQDQRGDAGAARCLGAPSGRARSPTRWRASRSPASTPRTTRCCRRSRSRPRSTRPAWTWRCPTSDTQG